MKDTQNIRLLSFVICIAIYFSNCSTGKYLENEHFLISQNRIEIDGRKIKNKEAYTLIKQKPNKKILGFWPIYLNFYNLAAKKKQDHYFKKIGEPPTIFNYRLARKSASQIELYYKNKGYLDAKTSFEINKKRHKVKVTYTLNKGLAYKINEVNINSDLNGHYTEILKSITSKISKGRSYKLNYLKQLRSNIASKLQNDGYYQFNKEFIYFIADTNYQKKEINLELGIKPIERFQNEKVIKYDHKIGFIERINVHLDIIKSESINDTTSINGINFIYSKSNNSFHLKRLANKILISPGILFRKNLVDKSYQALSELKNFKKIEFEFSPIRSDNKKDDLVANIYLNSGNKIAYSFEVEATENPELKQGISGSATLSHYNILKGGEHLQLTFKGANNFRNINENGGIINLTIPSLISPVKLRSILNKSSRTKTIFTASIVEINRPEFTRNSITGSFNYEWNLDQNLKQKLSIFNLSYVNFQGETGNLSNISEYLIAKDYSSHFIPTSSYTLTLNNQNTNKLKNYSFCRVHVESSGNILRALANPLNFEKLKNQEGDLILQSDGSASFTLKLWNNENIFTQYLKTSFDYRYYINIDKKNSIAIRSMTGIIYAYGNTSQAPFHKKFIAGGANDLRGWQAFKKPTGNSTTNSDTLFTGGLKHITSIEYRFNLLKKLKGATFVDAGNIWEISSNNSNYEAANFKWNEFINQIAIDAGFGLRFDLKYFIFRTDLAFIIRDPSKDSIWRWDKINLNNSQLNIGLGYPF